MRNRKQDRLAEIRQAASALGIAMIGEQEFQALRERLSPVGEPALRRLLRDVDLPLAPVVEGVRQETFDSLERTLNALAGEYQWAKADRARTRMLRRLVITAKEHARFAAKSTRDDRKRLQKLEMAEWMLVWLENPGVFAEWAKLRRRAATPIRSSLP
jgi:hypothetical protein